MCDNTSTVNLECELEKLFQMIKFLRNENKLQNKKLRALCRRIECLEEAQFGHIVCSPCSTTQTSCSSSDTSSSSSSCEIDKLQTKLDNLYKITFNNKQTCSKPNNNQPCNKC